MAVDVYTLVESLLLRGERLSRNKYLNAYSDGDFQYAMRLVGQLRTILEHAAAGARIHIVDTPDGMHVWYQGRHRMGDYRCEAFLTPAACGILQRLLPAGAEASEHGPPLPDASST